MKKFKLEIELGNDAMVTAWDVNNAVSNAMKRRLTGNTALIAGDRGRIADVNGNKVGSWVVEGDDEEEEET